MEIFTNREVATALWFGIFIGFCCLHPKIRKPLYVASKSLFQTVLVNTALILIIYIECVVLVLQEFHIWDATQLKATVVWTVTFIFVSMSRVVNTKKEDLSFGNWIKENLGFLVLIEFLISNYNFSFLIEFFLVPLVTFLSILIAVAERKPEHKAVAAVLLNLFGLLGFFLIAHAIYGVTQNIGGFLSLQTAQDVSMPPLLSLLSIPLFYSFYVAVTYERVFTSFDSFFSEDRIRRYIKRKTLVAFAFRFSSLERWKKVLLLNPPKTKKEVDEKLRDFLIMIVDENKDNPVDPIYGWQPQKARGFLQKIGIEANDYDEHGSEWFASSYPFILNKNALLPDTLSYYIEGDRLLAKRLKLSLFLLKSEHQEDSERTYQAAILELIKNSMDSSAEVQENLIFSKVGSISTELHLLTMTSEPFVSGMGWTKTFAIEIKLKS